MYGGCVLLSIPGREVSANLEFGLMVLATDPCFTAELSVAVDSARSMRCGNVWSKATFGCPRCTTPPCCESRGLNPGVAVARSGCALSSAEEANRLMQELAE